MSDGALTSSCSAPVEVRDRTPPVVLGSDRVVATLWPPNHRLVVVGEADIAPLLADACGRPAAWTIAACVSDQADDATGDGETGGDCLVAADGRSVAARAERDGARPEGRTYSILAVGRDECGDATLPTLVGRVHVPRDRR